MADFIRLNARHNIKDLLRFLGASDEQVIYIAIAPASPLWHEKALLLIKRAEKESGKKLVLVTTSRVSQILAQKSGLASLTEMEVFRRSPRASQLRPMAAKRFSSPLAWLAPGSNSKSLPAKTSRFPRRGLFFTASIVLALAAGVVTSNFTLAKAEITVFARTSTIDGNMDFFIGNNPGTQNVVSAFNIKQTFSVESKFRATGKENNGKKSAGAVELRSSHTSTLTLRADTTYLFTPDNRRFRFAQNVSGLRPGTPMKINVVAEQAGGEMNLAAGTRLEIFNNVLGNQPTVLFAEVLSPGFSGGTSEELIVVSDTDLSRARDELQVLMFQDAEKYAAGLNGSNKLLPDLVKMGILQEFFSAKVGDSVEEFSGSLRGEVEGLVISQEELTDLVVKHISKSVTATQKFVGLKPGLIYLVRTADLAKKVAALNVKFIAEVSTVLDEGNVKVLLAGKTADEIKTILLKKPEIASVKVDLSPFWLTTTPKDPKRLKIRFDLAPATSS